VGGWGANILKDARHWIGLLPYNLSTGKANNSTENKTIGFRQRWK
jgi:hypothetical protein